MSAHSFSSWRPHFPPTEQKQSEDGYGAYECKQKEDDKFPQQEDDSRRLPTPHSIGSFIWAIEKLVVQSISEVSSMAEQRKGNVKPANGKPSATANAYSIDLNKVQQAVKDDTKSTVLESSNSEFSPPSQLFSAVKSASQNPQPLPTYLNPAIALVVARNHEKWVPSGFPYDNISISDFGGVGDGVRLNTKVFREAIY
ncbi:hypothetical protein TB2_014016 [Malus domestica]